MPYSVHKGRLVFAPNTGNGPCARRFTGSECRRHIRLEGMAEDCTVHATKGRHRDNSDRLGGAGALQWPTALPEPRPVNLERVRRNSPATYGGAATKVAPEVVSRQRRRWLARHAG